MIRRIDGKSGKRIIILGLDGASFNYLDPILKSGSLPSFKRLFENGIRSDCLSTIPPLTPPAWSTMLTGVNPGKHGIFDFIQPDKSGIFRMVDAAFRRRRSFLDVAKENDIRTISLLVPYTFPPDKGANGLVVSGLGTPSAESDFIRSHSFRDVLLNEFPYLKGIDPTRGQSLETLHKHLLDYTKETVRLTQYAMSNVTDWGICFTVFQATDLIPHFYARYFDPSHPDYSPVESGIPSEYRDSLASIYRAIDGFLGECLDIVEKEGGWVYLVSDHGSQPLVGAIGKDAFLTRWLESQGYLVTSGGTGKAVQSTKARVGSVANRLLYLAKRYTPHQLRNAVNRIMGKRKEALVSKLSAIPFLDDVVWEKTQAFCAPGGYGVGLYINREGDFPQGIVPKGGEYFKIRDKIIDGLRALQIAPGVPLFNKVLAREDALWGPEIGFAPDLFLLWREDKILAERNYTLVDGQKLDLPECKAGSRLRWCGTHRIEGLFGVAGDSIRKGITLGKIPNLADVMPTILYTAGLGVPSDVDGRILDEVFESGFVESNPPISGPPEGGSTIMQDEMSESDSEKLLDLLEGLGYLN